MSRPTSSDAPAGPYRKPRPDLYTMLLIVALLALVIGTVFLYLESARYGPTPPGQPTVSTAMLVPLPAHPTAPGYRSVRCSAGRFAHCV